MNWQWSLYPTGIAVTVVTPAPGLSSQFEISELDGVTICRFRSGEIKNVSKVKRAINEIVASLPRMESV